MISGKDTRYGGEQWDSRLEVGVVRSLEWLGIEVVQWPQDERLTLSKPTRRNPSAEPSTIYVPDATEAATGTRIEIKGLHDDGIAKARQHARDLEAAGEATLLVLIKQLRDQPRTGEDLERRHHYGVEDAASGAYVAALRCAACETVQLGLLAEVGPDGTCRVPDCRQPGKLGLLSDPRAEPWIAPPTVTRVPRIKRGTYPEPPQRVRPARVAVPGTDIETPEDLSVGVAERADLAVTGEAGGQAPTYLGRPMPDLSGYVVVSGEHAEDDEHADAVHSGIAPVEPVAAVEPAPVATSPAVPRQPRPGRPAKSPQAKHADHLLARRAANPEVALAERCRDLRAARRALAGRWLVELALAPLGLVILLFTRGDRQGHWTSLRIGASDVHRARRGEYLDERRAWRALPRARRAELRSGWQREPFDVVVLGGGLGGGLGGLLAVFSAQVTGVLPFVVGALVGMAVHLRVAHARRRADILRPGDAARENGRKGGRPRKDRANA